MRSFGEISDSESLGQATRQNCQSYSALDRQLKPDSNQLWWSALTQLALVCVCPNLLVAAIAGHLTWCLMVGQSFCEYCEYETVQFISNAT